MPGVGSSRRELPAPAPDLGGTGAKQKKYLGNGDVKHLGIPQFTELPSVHTVPEPPALTLGSRRLQKTSKKQANTMFLYTPHATHLQRPRKASLPSEEKKLLIHCRKHKWRPKGSGRAGPMKLMAGELPSPHSPCVSCGNKRLLSPFVAKAHEPPCTLRTLLHTGAQGNRDLLHKPALSTFLRGQHTSNNN